MPTKDMTGAVPGPERPLRVLVADDHPIFLAGMCQLLDTRPDLTCVGAATAGGEAVELAIRSQPDVAVLDLHMPDLSGVDAARLITSRVPTVGVLMLTMLDDDDSVFAAIRAGARGYLLKGARPLEVIVAIQTVASGAAVFGPSIAVRIMDYFAVSRAAGGREPLPELTDREREILGYLADGDSNASITKRLVLSPKTVRNHVSNIFAKLHVSDRGEAMRRAREAGLGGR